MDKFRRQLKQLIAYGLSKAGESQLESSETAEEIKKEELPYQLLGGFPETLSLISQADWETPHEEKRLALENCLKKFHLSSKKLASLPSAQRIAARLNALELFCRCYYPSRDIRFFNGALWAWEGLLSESEIPRRLLEPSARSLEKAGEEFLRLMGEKGVHPLPGGFQ